MCAYEDKEGDGVFGNSKEEVKGVWIGHFECLMNEVTGGMAVVLRMGMEAHGK